MAHQVYRESEWMEVGDKVVGVLVRKAGTQHEQHYLVTQNGCLYRIDFSNNGELITVTHESLVLTEGS